MPLLDDLIPAEPFERFGNSLLGIDAQINSLIQRKQILYGALRVQLRAEAEKLLGRPLSIAETKALMAEAKARLDTRRKQPRTIQAGVRPAGTKRMAIEHRVPRVCVARHVSRRMARAA